MAKTFSKDDDSVVVIIGSGAGGGTLAHELAKRQVNCVVLEAGKHFTPADYENDEWNMFGKITWFDKRLAVGSNWDVVKVMPNLPAWMVKGVGARPSTGQVCRCDFSRMNSRSAPLTAQFPGAMRSIGRLPTGSCPRSTTWLKRSWALLEQRQAGCRRCRSATTARSSKPAPARLAIKNSHGRWQSIPSRMMEDPAVSRSAFAFKAAISVPSGRRLIRTFRAPSKPGE